MKKEIWFCALFVILEMHAVNLAIAQTPAPPAAPAPPAVPSQAPPAAPAQPAPPATPQMMPPANSVPYPQNQGVTSNGLFLGTNSVNPFLTNQSGLISNQVRLFATNQFGANAFAGTNRQVLSNQTISVTEDQAISVADQRLLSQIRARLQPVLGLTKPFTPAFPVHMIVQNNVVTLLGQIATETQRQQILTIVQRTPGVLQVNDQLSVNPEANAGFFPGNENPPGFSGSNGFPLASTNRVPSANRY
jgi:BON domain-containing protein